MSEATSIYPSWENVLSEEFLVKYRGKQPNWGFSGLGYIVYKRTYARAKLDGTTEEWWETLERCIKGAQKIGAKYTREEAERLYDYMFNLKCSFSGRGLWQLGTPLADMYADSLLNCFAGETKVLTRQGWKKIESLIGKNVEIVTDHGKWVFADFSSYGQQALQKLIVKNRQNILKEIFVTSNHRWILINKKGSRIEKTTNELTKGDLLPIVKGKCSSEYLSPQGITHGLVYGDGSCNGYESHIDLIDNTLKYCEHYFNNNRKFVIEENRHTRYSGMPNYYKDLPNINENKPYLLGFLAGWIAADGNVHKNNGSIRLFNKSKEVLLFAKDIASVCGIRTSEPFLEREHNPFDESDDNSELWSISFYTSDNAQKLIIREDHRNNLHTNVVNYDNYYTVVSVEPTERFETVYCASVPETHSFVIENNILTGNCWGTKISDIDDFCFIFMESMFGGGVGCNITKEYGFELPKIKKDVRVRLKNTKDADYIVPDSKEGWCDLWRNILHAYFISGKSFTFSTICIRPEGEPLKTFGGIAPGPRPLIEGTKLLIELLEKREGKKLRTQDIADIIAIGGEIVKSGGVRRTAIILGGDPDDINYLELKRWDLCDIPFYRSNTNNSIIANYYKYLVDKFWDGYKGNGECYGLLNLRNARRFGRTGEAEFNGLDLREPNIIIANPCGEALLEDKEPCNLAEGAINNISSLTELKDIVKLLYKTCKAICARTYYHEATNKVVHRNFKIGISLTGICQKLDVIDEWSDEAYKELRSFDKEWSKLNGYPESIRLTVVQPSGTKGLLFGAMPGCHPGYAKYFIRRIRFASTDPLISTLKSLGVNLEYEKKFDGSLRHDVLVAEFPCKFDNGIISSQMTAIQQLDIVKKLQKTWADQAVSCTVYFRENELDNIKQWLKENYDDYVKTVSFLKHSDHNFAQAPYEEITEEIYHKMVKKIKPLTTANITSNEVIDGIDCAGGACPVR